MSTAHRIKRGVSLYSFQEEYFLRTMSLEDCIRAAASFGARLRKSLDAKEGVAIVKFTHSGAQGLLGPAHGQRRALGQGARPRLRLALQLAGRHDTVA